jgi:dTDP-4-amino-4,6-dideoxygalactose transaminase
MNNERINVVMPSLPPYEEYIEEIKSIWDTHILTNQGPKYLQLEASLKEHFNAPNLLMFCNGHVALEIAIEALQFDRGNHHHPLHVCLNHSSNC